MRHLGVWPETKKSDKKHSAAGGPKLGADGKRIKRNPTVHNLFIREVITISLLWRPPSIMLTLRPHSEGESSNCMSLPPPMNYLTSICFARSSLPCEAIQQLLKCISKHQAGATYIIRQYLSRAPAQIQIGLNPVKALPLSAKKHLQLGSS